ncbi:MAG: conjugal transfer protein TraX [Candidatus Bathyarchaeota archaeon]|nr:conjugal transfer protein TraX [Candidatus Bathyarchaeum sp.]
MYLRGFDSGRELLKWVAIITMTVDHVGAVLYPDFEVLRWIGRLSFPLFAYLLVLGMENTRNIRKYFTRLFVFALISQVPFFLAVDYAPFESFNIFFTLSFGLLFVYLFNQGSVIAFVPLLVSLALPFDYGVYGLATIGCMYMLRKNTNFGVTFLFLLNALFLVAWNTQFLSLFALPLILLHNNGSLTRTTNFSADFKMPAWRKYFFYVYYPLHLFLLYLLKVYFF